MGELMNEGELKIVAENGQLKLQYEGKGGGAIVYAEAGYFLDKLAEAIPGEIDDAIIALLKGAFKAID